MSIISLTVAPLMEQHNEDWDVWYYGLIPLGVMVIGTFLVYQLFWAETQDITAAPVTKEAAAAEEPETPKEAEGEAEA